MRPVILVFVLAMTALPVLAEVFRYTDKNGNVVFTDEPPEGAEKIEVREVPTIEMPRGPLTEENLQRAASPQDTRATAGYTRVSFTEPENESAFWSGSGNIVLGVTATPELEDSHRFEVLLDGASLGTNQSGRFDVRHVDRGTHTATVRVLNRNGDVVEAGQAISFTVHRPSVNN